MDEGKEEHTVVELAICFCFLEGALVDEMRKVGSGEGGIGVSSRLSGELGKIYDNLRVNVRMAT